MLPDEFIPIAEHNGLIQPLSRWVLERALRQCNAWRGAGLEIPVAVNLSMRDLRDPTLPEYIEELLKRWDVPCACLVVEITESAIMADPDRAIEVLHRLSAMGIKIAIDDFGIGYSSLGYLNRLPVDQIKIDKSFVLNMVGRENDLAIVRSTIELGHYLGLPVLAEGVENQETWELLDKLGADAAQGYFPSHPWSSSTG
jgi:diguanylate cyclase